MGRNFKLAMVVKSVILRILLLLGPILKLGQVPAQQSSIKRWFPPCRHVKLMMNRNDNSTLGEVAEWSKAAVLKTVEG